MGILGDVFNATVGVVTGDTSKVTGLADSVGDLFNRATGATQANQWQWDMWNAQNAYNTPEAQMERLKAAGLNPMLVYGHGSVAGNTAGSMSAASPAGSGALGAVGSLLKSPFVAAKMSQDLQLGQEQIEQVKANKEVALATAGKIRAEGDILRNQIDNTPPGMDIGGSKGPVEKIIRALYNIAEDSANNVKSKRPDVYDPNLPALGRNVRR